MDMRPEWEGFNPDGLWTSEVNVRDFIQANYTQYDGDESFLAGPTTATKKLFDELQKLQKAEYTKKSVGLDGKERNGVLDMDTDVITSLTSHAAGYICPEGKDLEQVVGLQTDKPLKRAFMPYGGIKMAEQACEMYGYKPNPEIHKIFTENHKTHSDAVFDVYTPEIRKARKAHILTGLPDTYGRGRIVGDYRRVALYGIDYLIEQKELGKLKKQTDVWSVARLTQVELDNCDKPYLPITLGYTGFKCFKQDLYAIKHLLITGRTGTGKTTLLKSILTSINRQPKTANCKIVLIDTKNFDFNGYSSTYLMTPVITNAEKAVEYLNQIQPNNEDIAIIIDELADLIAVKSDIQNMLVNLAKNPKIHIIVATRKIDLLSVDFMEVFHNRVAFNNDKIGECLYFSNETNHKIHI